jgi:hypothetical protein
MKATLTFAAAALLLSLAACGEKPQRVLSEPQSATAPGGRNGDLHSDLRERTLRQGEAGRMAY